LLGTALPYGGREKKEETEEKEDEAEEDEKEDGAF